MRTNIDIDDDLMREAMRASGAATLRETFPTVVDTVPEVLACYFGSVSIAARGYGAPRRRLHGPAGHLKRRRHARALVSGIRALGEKLCPR